MPLRGGGSAGRPLMPVNETGSVSADPCASCSVRRMTPSRRRASRPSLSSAYTVTSRTDRMGCHLEGPSIEHRDGFNIISDGIVNGSIQVPGSGYSDHSAGGPAVDRGLSEDRHHRQRGSRADRAGAHRRDNPLRGRFGRRGGALRPRMDERIDQVIATIEPVALDGLSTDTLMKVNLIGGVVSAQGSE